MRTLILIAALGLAACSGNDTANNQAVSEEAGAAAIGPVNDITAIDAATGEAANMAANVNYTFEDLGNETGNGSANAVNAVGNGTTNR